MWEAWGQQVGACMGSPLSAGGARLARLLPEGRQSLPWPWVLDPSNRLQAAGNSLHYPLFNGSIQMEPCAPLGTCRKARGSVEGP